MAGSASLLSAFFLIFMVSSVHPYRTTQHTMGEDQPASGVNRFAQKFYKSAVEQNPGENLFMSPMSTESVLALLSLGAEGETLHELNNAMQVTSTEQTRNEFKSFIEKLNRLQGVTLNVANKIFVQKNPNYTLKDSFKKDAEDIFKSEVQSVDFKQKAQAVEIINTWVKDKTERKIKELVSIDTFSDDSNIILVNAIYFKGSWEHPFDKDFTYSGDFFVNPNLKKKTDLMRLTAHLKYAKIPEWDAKVLELPYKNSKMSMVIVLPNNMGGIEALKGKISAKTTDIITELTKMELVEVDVQIPKFRIETTMNLQEILPKMGIKRIFDTENIELQGMMTQQCSIHVTSSVQKAVIEVNEEGAEAAAATEMEETSRSLFARHHVKKFMANHPFMFFMVANEQILFIGSFEKLK